MRSCAARSFGGIAFSPVEHLVGVELVGRRGEFVGEQHHRVGHADRIQPDVSVQRTGRLDLLLAIVARLVRFRNRPSRHLHGDRIELITPDEYLDLRLVIDQMLNDVPEDAVGRHDAHRCPLVNGFGDLRFPACDLDVSIGAGDQADGKRREQPTATPSFHPEPPSESLLVAAEFTTNTWSNRDGTVTGRPSDRKSKERVHQRRPAAQRGVHLIPTRLGVQGHFR